MPDPTAPPPAIEGFRHERLLGSGGFADVYLYNDLDLERPVAIKVLRSLIGDTETQEAFVAESKLMAKVSGHPYIVQIYRNGVAADGRPYLVMQYYPGQSYATRLRSARFSVAETLETGVRISSALETAHRAGIVHRDVKPANLLTDNFGKPGLTDFGIAGAFTDASLGFSPPFAPPEIVLDHTGGDARSDVFSLAATLYAMLVGRSPFETGVGKNSRSAVSARVLNDDPFPILRDDVAPIFVRLIEQGLAKDAGDRLPSALAFGRSLQSVQQSLHYAATPLELETDIAPTHAAQANQDDADRTKFGGVRVVDPEQAPTAPSPTAPSPGNERRNLIGAVPDTFSSPASEVRSDAASGPMLPEPTEEGTILRPQLVTSGADTRPVATPVRSGPRWQVVVAGVAVALLAIGAGVAVTTIEDGHGGAVDEVEAVPGGGLVIVAEPDKPTNIILLRSDGVVGVSWDVETALEGDQYQVTYTIDEGEPMIEMTSSTTIDLDSVPAGAQICVSLLSIRSGRFSGSTVVECIDGR